MDANAMRKEFGPMIYVTSHCETCGEHRTHGMFLKEWFDLAMGVDPAEIWPDMTPYAIACLVTGECCWTRYLIDPDWQPQEPDEFA